MVLTPRKMEEGEVAESKRRGGEDAVDERPDEAFDDAVDDDTQDGDTDDYADDIDDLDEAPAVREPEAGPIEPPSAAPAVRCATAHFAPG